MYNPAIDLSLHMLGDLTVRIQNDVMVNNPGYTPTLYTPQWQGKTAQTWGVEWKGDIAGVKPLLQYFSFDQGHSWSFDVGLMLSIAGLGVTADWMTMAESQKVIVAGHTNVSSKINNSNRYSLEVNYVVPNIVTPYVYWSNYKNKPWSNDPGANSAPGKWDHDGQVISIGVIANGISPNFMPYLAFDMQSGKFIDTAPAKTQSTKTDFIIRLGATAHF